MIHSYSVNSLNVGYFKFEVNFDLNHTIPMQSNRQ